MIKLISVILFSLIFTINLSALDKVSLQLHWKYQFEFAGFIAAKEKGFYKDAGLDVELKEYDFGLNIVDEVIKGHSTYGVYNSNIIVSYLENKPVKLVSSFFKRSALVIITRPEIKSPIDLVGKTIMAATKKDFDFNFKYMFAEENIDTNQLHFIPHSYTIQEFIDGKCDAMTAFISDQPYKLDQLGIKYNIIDPSDYGIYNLQLELFTSDKEITQHPQRVKKFKNATIKGWKYALSHVDEIVDIIDKKYNRGITKDSLKYEAKVTSKLILSNIYPIGSYDTNFLKKQFELFSDTLIVDHNQTLDNFLLNISNNIKHLNLTPKEQEYLHNKKELVACVKKDWLPYESISNGEFIGMSADFLRLYTNKLNLKLKILLTENQLDSLIYLKTKKCDVKPFYVTASNIKTIPYVATIPFFHDNISLVTRLEQGYIQDLSSVDKTVLITRGFRKFILFLKQKYPKIKLQEVSSTKKALRMVASSEAFGYIGTSLASSYMIQKEFSSELKIVNSFKNIDFGVGVVEDDKILRQILNKTIFNTTKEEENQIYNKWIATTIEKPINYTLAWQITGAILILLLFIIYRHILTIKYNKTLESEIKEQVAKNREKDQQMLQQNRLAQMGEMISMIAHQWRQPLTAISATSTALQLKAQLGSLNNAKTIELTQKISELSQHLSSTIDDFRDFFKNNKVENLTTCNHLVESTLKIVETSITNKNIELKLDLNCDMQFLTYPNEVKQVLLNLLKNAEDVLIDQKIEQPKISILTKNHIIVIKDNGGGVPPDIMNKIFDPYFSTKLKKDGTGLGLYMSKIIIEEHCGGVLNITNDSEGAVFTIDFSDAS